VQTPIASTATEQSARNLDSFINFLCPLNIINVLLLQASTSTQLKLFTYQTDYLLFPQATTEYALRDSPAPEEAGRNNPAGMLQSVI